MQWRRLTKEISPANKPYHPLIEGFRGNVPRTSHPEKYSCRLACLNSVRWGQKRRQRNKYRSNTVPFENYAPSNVAAWH